MPAVLLLLLVFPATAQAHTVVQGMSEFVNGLLHPLTTPAHVLVLLGLGLMLGQRTPLNLRTPIFVFVPLSAIALLLTQTQFIQSVYQPLLISIALCVATLVALERALPPAATGVLLGAAALALGFDSAPGSGTRGAVLKTLLGTWVCLVLVVFDLAFYISSCKKWKWGKIGMRVLGSWIIAISLLVLAFSFRR